MSTPDAQPLVMTLTRLCIRRGILTLPGRHRDTFTPGPLLATDAHGSMHSLTLEPNHTLTGLLPFFIRQDLQPNDALVFTPTDEPQVFQLHAVKKPRRASRPEPAPDPPVPTPPMASGKRTLYTLKALIAQYALEHAILAEEGEVHQDEPVLSPPAPVSSEPPVEAPLVLTDALLAEPEPELIWDQPAREQPQARRKPFGWNEEELTDEPLTPEPAWQQTFSSLPARLASFLSRSGRPLIVRTEQLARELNEHPDAIEEALRGEVDPDLEVSRLRYGLYRIAQVEHDRKVVG